jgi:hypothetical protein
MSDENESLDSGNTPATQTLRGDCDSRECQRARCVRELPTTRSASALASPARTSSAICAIVKPCVSIGDSVQQSCGQSASNAPGGGQGWRGGEHAGRMVPNVFSVPITVPVAIRLLLLKQEELDVSED